MVKNKMLKKVAVQAFEIVKSEYNTLVAEINSMEDTLNYLRSKGVQDYETQVEVLSDQYGAALVSNNNKAAEKINNRLDTLSKYGQSFQSKVVSALITDNKFLDTISEITTAKFFENDANKWIVSEILSYPNISIKVEKE